MGTIKLYTMIKSHFARVNTRFLPEESLLKKMLSFFSIFLASVSTLILKIFGFVSKFVNRSNSRVVEENGSNFSDNHSQKDDRLVSNISPVFLSSGLAGKELQSSRNDLNGNITETEDSVFLQSSKYQFLSGKDASGFLKEPKTEQFLVHEIFVGSNDVLFISDQGKDSLEEETVNNQEFVEETESSSFCFKLLNGFSGQMSELENINEEKADNSLKILSREDIDEKDDVLEDKNVSCSEEINEDDEILEDKDVSYEVELLPTSQISALDASANDIFTPTQEIVSTDKSFLEGNDSMNWMSDYLDKNDEDLDDDYIELEPFSSNLIVREIISAHKADELHEHDATQTESQEPKSSWDLDDDEDDDDDDVLWGHQNLVQQMKMELKNGRIRGLPTISEECETPKMADDMKPLEIDQKIEYKDIMEEIQKFYKSYMEKMRKLDILNYQTLHAISFLQLKDAEVFTAGKKNPFILPKIWPCKGQRIFADPMHKTIAEMHRDLELVYVGQLCLSSEILCWLYAKARELLEYDLKGNHSYNRAAEDFQQFQVLLQRFMEDEPFQGQRIQNYVRNRCLIRSLLQVPTITDDCLKSKKERTEETDAIPLQLLVKIIRESMLIFHEFLFADKKGIHGIKIDLQDPENSELLVDIITNHQKKERRIKEQVRSQNCIVKKLKKHHERRLDDEILTSQVELRLVSRVLNLSRLTTDQLLWCQNKLNNICFVGRKVHVEPSFLLFPC